MREPLSLVSFCGSPRGTCYPGAYLVLVTVRENAFLERAE